jgi:hypothetical protein
MIASSGKFELCALAVKVTLLNSKSFTIDKNPKIENKKGLNLILKFKPFPI